jgi:hypothetical protein
VKTNIHYLVVLDGIYTSSLLRLNNTTIWNPLILKSAHVVDPYAHHCAQNERLNTAHRTNVCLFLNTQYNKIKLN